jgi:hypothetical protein
VSRYLETTAAAQETSENAQAFLAALENKRNEAEKQGKTIEDTDGWHLLPMEKLQLLDVRPSTMAELLLVVENCHERFSQDQVIIIIIIIVIIIMSSKIYILSCVIVVVFIVNSHHSPLTHNILMRASYRWLQDLRADSIDRGAFTCCICR